jgi:quercetin dioxygenase-like cupin family protein
MMSGLPVIATMLEQVSWVPADPLIRVLHLTLEPGAAGTPPHKHPGPVIGYVLEGQLDFQMADHDPVAIRAGETFLEPYGCVHLRAANGSQSAPARFIAVIIGRQGLPIILPPDWVDEEAR